MGDFYQVNIIDLISKKKSAKSPSFGAAKGGGSVLMATFINQYNSSKICFINHL